jgi:hypothetical protein
MGERAEGTLARLMRAYDVHDDAALAIHLGRDMSTIRVWRSRDMVPLLILAEASKATGYSVQWLRGDEGAEPLASTRSPDDENRVALTPRELALIERYRATTEEGRSAVEVVASTLSGPAGITRRVGDRCRAGRGADCPGGAAGVAR